MKTSLLAGIVASLFLLTAASADAAPRKKHRTRPAEGVVPASATALDAARGSTGGETRKEPARSPKQTARGTARASQFIASGVPLVEVAAGRLKAVGSAKRPCGKKSTWAKIGSAWSALDAWGQIVQSRTTISDRRFFEGSGCQEVSFSLPPDVSGAARLFVARGSGYAPAASFEWKADRDRVKRFEALCASQESAWVEGRAASGGDDRHAMFFRLPKQDGSVEGAPTERRPTQWAVAGGRVLIVAYVGASGAWKVGHVMPPNGKDHAYEPLAILDMNGDGLPEIVVHEEAGGVFVDRVLSFDPGAMRWERSIESPGGATR